MGGLKDYLIRLKTSMTQKAQDIDDLKGHLAQDIDDPVTFVKILILSIVTKTKEGIRWSKCSENKLLNVI
jgi:hypothetical protein